MALYAIANRTTEESSFIIISAFIVHGTCYFYQFWINIECLQKLTMLLIWDRLRKCPRKDWLFRLDTICLHCYLEVPYIQVVSFTSLLHCVFILDVLEYSSVLTAVAVKLQLCNHQKLSAIDVFQKRFNRKNIKNTKYVTFQTFERAVGVSK